MEQELRQQTFACFIILAMEWNITEKILYSLQIHDFSLQVIYNTKRTPLNKLLGKIDFAKVHTSIVLLDACRDNPFAKNWNGRNYVSKGLASINQLPNGMFIGFAASPGQTASDGIRRNGTYTEAILKFIGENNLSIDVLFNRVNKEVRAETNNKQVPYKNSSLDDEFYFQKNGEEINNFTQEEFDKRVDTLVEAKLKEREAADKSESIPNNIKKLFNPNESVIGSALSSLLIESPKDFSGGNVITICKAYEKYIDKQTRIIGQTDWDFLTLLDSIAQQNNFNDTEIRDILKYYDQESKYSEVTPIILKIIDSSKADFVTSYFKNKIEQNDASHLGEMYFDRFLRIEYLQPVTFYLNYLNRMDKTSSQIKSTFDSFINFFYSINVYKTNIIGLLNNQQIVDSVFVHGQIYYEQNFINYRSWLKKELINWIDEATLNRTYFFSTLCPCILAVSPSGRGERQFPCK